MRGKNIAPTEPVLDVAAIYSRWNGHEKPRASEERDGHQADASWNFDTAGIYRRWNAKHEATFS